MIKKKLTPIYHFNIKFNIDKFSLIRIIHRKKTFLIFFCHFSNSNIKSWHKCKYKSGKTRYMYFFFLQTELYFYDKFCCESFTKNYMWQEKLRIYNSQCFNLQLTTLIVDFYVHTLYFCNLSACYRFTEYFLKIVFYIVIRIRTIMKSLYRFWIYHFLLIYYLFKPRSSNMRSLNLN